MKPRTPEDWWNVVSRMADKPALFEPLLVDDLQTVTAYLIAISPDLQKVAQAQARRRTRTRRARPCTRCGSTEVDLPSVLDARPAPELPLDAAVVADAAPVAAKPAPVPDRHGARQADLRVGVLAVSRDLGRRRRSAEDQRPASALIQRMITDNDAELSSRQRRLVLAWLVERYVKGKR
jgi:hypothetical protein